MCSGERLELNMRKGEGVHGGIATCLLVGKETRTPVQSVRLSKGGKLIV